MLINLRRYILDNSLYNLRLYCANSFEMATGEKVGVNLNEVIKELEDFAPKKLAENWDNTGLLVEPYTPR